MLPTELSSLPFRFLLNTFQTLHAEGTGWTRLMCGKYICWVEMKATVHTLNTLSTHQISILKGLR